MITPHTILSHKSVRKAAAEMAQLHIGSLLVEEEGNIIGIGDIPSDIPRYSGTDIPDIPGHDIPGTVLNRSMAQYHRVS